MRNNHKEPRAVHDQVFHILGNPLKLSGLFVNKAYIGLEEGEPAAIVRQHFFRVKLDGGNARGLPGLYYAVRTAGRDLYPSAQVFDALVVE